MVHLTVTPGAEVSIPWDPSYNGLVYALSGSGRVGPDGAPLSTGQTAVMGPGDAILLSADAVQDGRHPDGLDVLLLGGAPIGEPVAKYGPFVMNTAEEIRQAFADYEAGRLGMIPEGGF